MSQNQILSKAQRARRTVSCRGCGRCDADSSSVKSIDSLVESVVKDVMASLFPGSASAENLIPVGVSARHMHITQEHLEQLFGEGHQLTKMRDLGQPGEFAAKETLAVVGPKRRLFEKIRILGPTRRFTQVELSLTDGVYLGVDLPHRISGSIEGSAPLILVGPKGVLHLKEGAIRARRHIHVSPEDALRLGLENGEEVSVRSSGPMSVTFNNVVVRMGDNLNLQMHIDTDEANAAGLRCGDPVELMK